MENIQERIYQELAYLTQTLFADIRPPDPAWHLNATLHLGSNDWDAYASGYKEIADMAVDQLLESQHMPDYQAYPIIFLYRHYLELRLKELLKASSMLFDEPARIPFDHHLLPLWQRIRPQLERLWNDEQSLARHNEITARLKEFDVVDAGSFSFRYPEDGRGNSNLQALSVINVKHIKDVVTAISHVLDGSSMGIDHHLEMKHEMESEYRAEMGYSE